MITCRSCNKSFEKPKRRGRPPVVCDDCKGGTKSPEKAVEPQVATSTPTTPDPAPSVGVRAAKKHPYRSGFCGITRHADGSIKNHPEQLHKRCSTQGGLCSCGCHKGETPWAA